VCEGGVVLEEEEVEVEAEARSERKKMIFYIISNSHISGIISSMLFFFFNASGKRTTMVEDLGVNLVKINFMR
jgi:hypothetical protein